MSKKKKGKNGNCTICDMVDFGIRILESGKLKLQKGCIISLDEISKDSIDNTIGSRMDALEDNSKVSSDESPKLQVSGINYSQMHCYKLLSRISAEPTRTLVVTLTRKEAKRAFNYMDSGVIGTLLRTSNLGRIYDAVRANWYELLGKSEAMDCILYIPAITIIADEDFRTILDTPNRIVNLLIYVEKEKKALFEMDDFLPLDAADTAQKRMESIIHGVLESAVRLGCTNLIINPFDNKLMMKDPRLTADTWHKELQAARVQNHVEKIDFSIIDDDLFIIFWKSKYASDLKFTAGNVLL